MVVTYHQITSSDSAYSYSVTRLQLYEHLEVIAELQREKRRASVSPQLTFDDGHKSNYANGLDLLEKRSFRATFFVVAGWISNRTDFMTWQELREMVTLGHEVQSHTWSHRVLTNCSAAELKEELVRSKRTIEDRLGIPVKALSVPHGRWNRQVLRACAAAGYQRVYISNPWISRQAREGLVLIGRYMVRRSLEAQQLRRLLAGDPAFLLFLRSQYRVKETLKLVMGHTVYHRLWSLCSRG